MARSGVEGLELALLLVIRTVHPLAGYPDGSPASEGCRTLPTSATRAVAWERLGVCDTSSTPKPHSARLTRSGKGVAGMLASFSVASRGIEDVPHGEARCARNG